MKDPMQPQASEFETSILLEIDALRRNLERPVVVALDGGSGSGKSTIAGRLVRLTDGVRIPLDDFYQTTIPESDWPHKSKEERVAGAFDWARVRRDALEPLRSGRPGRWHAFDFLQGLGPTGTYGLKEEAIECSPAPCIILDGAYSAAPFLRDLVDLAVLVDVPVAERHRRTAARDGAEFQAGWHAIWDEVESYYLAEVCPPESFDLVILNV